MIRLVRGIKPRKMFSLTKPRNLRKNQKIKNSLKLSRADASRFDKMFSSIYETKYIYVVNPGPLINYGIQGCSLAT